MLGQTALCSVILGYFKTYVSDVYKPLVILKKKKRTQGNSLLLPV